MFSILAPIVYLEPFGICGTILIHNKYPSLILLKIEARERERETIRLTHLYQDIISAENLLAAWREFLHGKRKRKDVAEFCLHLTDNILTLHHELAKKIYRHGSYRAFRVNDPKPRNIHKASVRDRLVHHAMYRVLYPYFDRKFISDSYSCRKNKGTHRAMNRLKAYAGKASHNHTRTVWVLKCDIRKFFASIDHGILEGVLARHIQDADTLWLLKKVIASFHIPGIAGIGLPLGNLTSQLLVNIYMNEFDQFLKRELKIRYYVRYADDFVLLHENKRYLENLLPQMSLFLRKRLNLSLHPDKIFLKTFASGIDFLGWVHFPYHRVLRTTTRRRIVKRLDQNPTRETTDSYRGLLGHGNTYKLKRKSFLE